EKLIDVFKILLEYNIVPLPKPYENPSAHWDRTKYCQFHRVPGHTTNTYFHFRDLVYDMNDRGVIKWAKVRKALEHAQHNQVQPRLQANMGIIQNPLPNHPPTQAQAQQPPPHPVGGQVPPPAAQTPPPQENVLRINTMIPICPRQLVTRVKMWSF